MTGLARTLAALAALAVSVSLAASPIRVDDSHVDYSDSDLTTGYLSLEQTNGTLTVVLDSRSGASAGLPVAMDGIPVILGTNIFGSTTYSGVLTDAGSPVTVEMTGNLTYGISVMHDGVTLSDAIAAYRAGLEKAGGSVEVELDGNYAVLTSSSGARIVLQNVFDGVRAHIAAA